MIGDLKVTAEGYAFQGWKSVNVTVGLEQLARTFSVSYTEPLSVENRKRLHPGTACKVAIGGDPVISGYVTSAPRSYDARTRTVSVAGRGLCGDLVDCAAIYKTGHWANAGILKIANDLCGPFSISSRLGEGIQALNPFRYFAIQDGETVFETLSRAAVMRGLLVTEAEDGTLVFARVGSRATSTVLKYGSNILRGSSTDEEQDQFSEYTIKAQMRGDDETSGKAAYQIKQTATDPLVKRYRPTIILAENEDSRTELKNRANWEANVRAAKARRVRYTVRGWRDESDDLWQPNTQILVDDPELVGRATLLISGVTLTADEQGEIAQLDLVSKQAFQPMPFVAPRPKRDAEGRY